MYIRQNLRWSIIWRKSWQSVLFLTLYNTVVCAVFASGFTQITIPWQPVATLGTAVAFYIGFKNNGSYDRFWEGRQIWGGIVNASRTWAIQALEYITSRVDAPDLLHEMPAATAAELTVRHRRLLYRHIAWCNALRLELRRQRAECWDTDVAPFLSEEESAFMRLRANPPTHLLRRQAAELRVLREERGLLNDFQHLALMQTLDQLFVLQGGCERIKNTPFPRQFAFYSFVFVCLFALLLPLGLLREFDQLGHYMVWLTVPFATLVAWVFNTIESVGHTSENPFENQMNDVPMTALCRTVEIDLREMLGETELPPPIRPIKDVLY
ncbi:bestrophin family protein [Hymenobacter koreensis]|uniref:Bestrophin family ion channel n=1 Tax=Hymenobacter koreensis TaxID=1084523 RepID=A0ABP8IWE0_9BACT